ncbi:hypothetical protein GGI43DRAFT_400133 [Trichoderma evansii]
MDQTSLNSQSVSYNNFGNDVTIIQGSGSDQANQCLKDLRSTDPRDDKIRIQNTKGGLLRDSYCWIFENETFKDWRNNAQNRILWIKGDPGKGKTMLLCGIIDELLPTTKLAKPMDQTTDAKILSYFFCQGTDARINTAIAILRGLMYLLIAQEPSLISHVQKKYNHAGKSLFSDVNAWVALSKVFVAILQGLKQKEVVLIIDALDECETDLLKLLDAIAKQFSFPHIKYIISSRNKISIQQRLESRIPQGILSLELKGNALCVSEAVDAYIEYSVSRLYSIQNDQKLQDDLRKIIQQKANGTFLWVSLVIKELEEVQDWQIMDVVKELPTDLMELYERMIKQVDNLRRESKLCRNILSAILTAYYPLSLAELGLLAGLPDQISKNSESIAKLVLMCGSFLTLNEDKVYFIHQSAKDFLFNGIFSTGAAQRHADVFKRSITAISNLPKNIYRLKDYGSKLKDVLPPNPDPLASMKYSCFYWAHHLCDSKYKAQLALKQTLEPFFEDSLLRWIESLSLLDGMSEGLRSIRKLLHEFNENPQLTKILSAIENFILRNGWLITRYPRQLYGSALLFSPAAHNEIIAMHWRERLSFIKDIQGTRTEGFLQMLEGHNDRVIALAFSPDGEMLASKSEDSTLRCWDVATGAQKQKIQCHDKEASAIAFLPDNKSLILVAYRNSIPGQDTGTCDKENLKNDDYWIISIALSFDNKTLDISRGDRMVQLNGILTTHMDHSCIQAFAFSSNCKTLASAFKSGRVQLWDATTGVYQRILKDKYRLSTITAIAFSPDGSKIASIDISTIQVWNTVTGEHLKMFDTGFLCLRSDIAFRQDNTTLLVGPIDSSSRLYDTTTGTIVQTFISRGNSAIAISPDNKILASASTGNYTIQLWDATRSIKEMSTEERKKLDCFGKTAGSTVLSPDGKTLALVKPNSMQLWDTTTGEYWETFGNHLLETNHLVFSADGKTLALRSNHLIEVWDVARNRQKKLFCSSPLEGDVLVLSADGKKLALGSTNKIKLWDVVKDTWWKTSNYRDRDTVSAITFSPDGNLLAVGFSPGSAMLFDTATGELLWMMESNWKEVVTNLQGREICNSIMFSSDGPSLYFNNQGIKYTFTLPQEAAENLVPDTEIPKALKYQGIAVTKRWITKDRRRLLYIPAEYRTINVFAHGNIVILRHDSGITFVWLNL